jgi:hypothetical protein
MRDRIAPCTGAPMKITRLFMEHPASVGETYFQHLAHASGFAFWMVAGGIACFIHALLPFLCVTTGSGIIRRLHDRMVVNRVRLDQGDAPALRAQPR